MVTFVTKPQIEQLVGTKIKNLDLYQKAFTHKSALKEYAQLNESFETLEFIGDSVLGFVITKFLFDQYESKQEGFLTKARTKLVRGETLANIAKILGLEKMVVMEEKRCGHRAQYRRLAKSRPAPRARPGRCVLHQLSSEACVLGAKCVPADRNGAGVGLINLGW